MREQKGIREELCPRHGWFDADKYSECPACVKERRTLIIIDDLDAPSEYTYEKAIEWLEYIEGIERTNEETKEEKVRIQEGKQNTR